MLEMPVQHLTQFEWNHVKVQGYHIKSSLQLQMQHLPSHQQSSGSIVFSISNNSGNGLVFSLLTSINYWPDWPAASWSTYTSLESRPKMTHATVNVTEVLSEMLCLPAKHDAARAACEQGVVHPKRPARRRLLRASHTEFAQWRPYDIKIYELIPMDQVRLASHKQGSSTDVCFPQTNYCIILYHVVSICFVLHNFLPWASSVTQTTNAMKESIQAAGPGQRQITSKASSYCPASSTSWTCQKTSLRDLDRVR